MNLHAAAARAAIDGLNRVCRQRDELQRRVDRTVEYAQELLDGPLDPNTRVAMAAVVKSLVTPIGLVDSERHEI